MVCGDRDGESSARVSAHRRNMLELRLQLKKKIERKATWK
jgi:hypothetical protein